MDMDSDSAAKAADEPDWLMDEPLEHAGAASEQASAPPWRVLIVDDDVDVHVVTKFALSQASF